MNSVPMTGHSPDSVEQMLRAELARGDAAIAHARPVMRYLLAHEGHALFSEAAVARVRGMMLDLAVQLLQAQAAAGEVLDRARNCEERQDELAVALMEDDALLAHAQALVVEADLVERLQARSGIDAVLSPLVQELAAENDETAVALAMALHPALSENGASAGRVAGRPVPCRTDDAARIRGRIGRGGGAPTARKLR